MQIKSQTTDWLFWSSYWLQHSRVLERRGGNIFYQSEIDLEPLGGDVERLADLIIRTHCTAPSGNDRFSHYIPSEVYQNLINLIGVDRAWIAMHADLYSMIDWGKYAKDGGNRIPLRNCLKEIPAPFLRTVLRNGKTVSDYTISKEGFFDDVICIDGLGEADGLGICGVSLDTSGDPAIGPTFKFHFWISEAGFSNSFVAKIRMWDPVHGMHSQRITGDLNTIREWMNYFPSLIEEILKGCTTQKWEDEAVQGAVKECLDYLAYKYLVKDIIMAPNNLEIERKWWIPEDRAEYFLEHSAASATRVETITQFYMGDKTRYRETFCNGDTIYHKTKKTGIGMVRTEIEEVVSKDEYDMSWKMAGRPITVQKTRYHMLVDDYIVHVDHYHDGSMTAEIEFADEATAKACIAPHWFGDEVTGVPGYSNFDMFLKLNHRPDPDLVYALGAGVLEFTYTNYKGETTNRKVIPPFELYFGKTEQHPEEQWFLKAMCDDRKAERHFALRDIKGFK